VHDGRLLVGSGQGTALELDEVQPEGKRRISAADFLRGYQLNSGESLGS
jgi:methionyl-tRNA formyltransferase